MGQIDQTWFLLNILGTSVVLTFDSRPLLFSVESYFCPYGTLDMDSVYKEKLFVVEKNFSVYFNTTPLS